MKKFILLVTVLYLFFASILLLRQASYGATVKAKGYVTVTIVAPETVPEPNAIVYTEVGKTLQVVF